VSKIKSKKKRERERGGGVGWGWSQGSLPRGRMTYLYWHMLVPIKPVAWGQLHYCTTV